ncbi:hypothetical protein ACFLW6_00060 [Chloroflexota bacterium]
MILWIDGGLQKRKFLEITAATNTGESLEFKIVSAETSSKELADG